MPEREDQELRALRRQRERYVVRFNEPFWAWFDATVLPTLAPDARITDVGCGPGMYLADMSARLPDARLTGVDANPHMLENARGLTYAGAPPALHLHDATVDLAPVADASVDLLTMSAVLHTFEDPWRFLAEAKRVLAPGERFLLYDWVRVPMADYIAQRMTEPGEPEPQRYQRALELFSTHNKYTHTDWDHVLAKGGFSVVAECLPTPHQRARCLLLKVA
jgi:ubiquinone/menaquinone biosynthesis C-methylase UbiE